MQRDCDECGVPYEAKRPSSRFCSDLCRKRGRRNPRPAGSAVQSPVGPGPLQAVTQARLGAADRLDTELGQLALALARRIDSLHETGASVASLSREYRAARAEALEGVGVAGDPLDELEARRRAKLAAG